MRLNKYMKLIRFLAENRYGNTTRLCKYLDTTPDSVRSLIYQLRQKGFAIKSERLEGGQNRYFLQKGWADPIISCLILFEEAQGPKPSPAIKSQKPEPLVVPPEVWSFMKTKEGRKALRGLISKHSK